MDKPFSFVNHPRQQARLVMSVYRYMLYVFHFQATYAFHVEIIFLLHAMACEPIIQAALKYKQCGFLSGTLVHVLGLYCYVREVPKIVNYNPNRLHEYTVDADFKYINFLQGHGLL